MAAKRKAEERAGGWPEARAASFERHYHDDEPLAADQDDPFGRTAFVDAIAGQILDVPAAHGFAIGLAGPWGSGKTTILNSIEGRLLEADCVAVMRFNPWLFSGTEQLIASLLSELSLQLHESQFGKKAKAAARAVGTYAGLLAAGSGLPVIGGVAAVGAGVMRGVGDVGNAEEHASLSRGRDRARAALKALDRRMVIVLDDVDRLADQEVRDLLRFVRLTADFPNTVYLLAFDRARVERVLDSATGEGSRYLEKIVQVIHDVPQTPPSGLGVLLSGELASLEPAITAPVSEVELTNTIFLLIGPLLRTPRDVYRIVNSLLPILEALGDEVAFQDILALEGLHVLRPNIYYSLMELHEELTNRTHSDQQRREYAERFRKVLASVNGEESIFEELLNRVFPLSSAVRGGPNYGHDFDARWRRERRAADPTVLRVFLERQKRTTAVATSVVKFAADNLGNVSALETTLSHVQDDQFEDLLERLCDYESEFQEHEAGVALTVFLSQWHRLRQGRRHSFDFGADIAMGRLALRLLRAIKREDDRGRAVRRATKELRSLSARLDLVDTVGYRKGVGHGLVAEDAARELEDQLWRDIGNAPSEQLAAERDAGALLLRAADADPSNVEVYRKQLSDPNVFLAFIRSLVSQSFSRTLGDAAERVEWRLPYEWVNRLLGDEAFAQHVNELEQAMESKSIRRELLDERGATAAAVAARYRDGWRPSRAGEDLDESASDADEESPDEPNFGFLASLNPEDLADGEDEQ